MITSDWLSLIEIFVTAGVGIWIATSIQTKSTASRALRDYFINELMSLQSDYRTFVNNIWDARLSSTAIKDTLKSLSGRITTLDKFMHKKFNLDSSLIKEAHVIFQQDLTYVPELDEQYSQPVVQLKHETKIRLMPLHERIVEAITERVININESKIKYK